MGFKVLAFSLFIFICFIAITSSAYPLHSTFSSEIMQKRKLEDKVIDGSKIEGGGGHGGNSHGNGNSGSSDTRGGGAAVIPVYAAGAANKNNQHQTRHGAASCNLNKIRFSNMLMIVLIYPLILSFLLI
ncbi:hypothetical protein LR48_Vigan02g251900 [Vigna angularis]|uniref:Glycine-rich protein n=2 Tax=Phaseolus angularis TaxID=3914 RepID=A0A0L9U1S4_PHAAN|nr:uncharacterized protein LOC108325242 [Vigna angularis]KAG2401154.1 uncharacterized protein HKW66_Vig0198100 [Vigna angularis]KOM36369.1 hypothetical protein LR48_Vigan02g251900 [Vigna angularis]BAT93720.1 hypothetical protein VIGAN_08024800 [Vigna angularis var. angularis]